MTCLAFKSGPLKYRPYKTPSTEQPAAKSPLPIVRVKELDSEQPSQFRFVSQDVPCILCNENRSIVLERGINVKRILPVVPTNNGKYFGEVNRHRIVSEHARKFFYRKIEIANLRC